MCCCVKWALKWILSCVCMLIITLVVIIVILYLVLRPKVPKFDVVAIEKIDRLEMDTSTNRLDAHVKLVLSSYNPNKVSVSYDTNNSIAVSSGGQNHTSLNSALVGGFKQTSKSYKNVTATWLSEGIVLDAATAMEISTNLSTGVLIIALKGRLTANAEYIGMNSPAIYVDLSCYVGINKATSSLSKEDTHCGVKIPVDQSA